MNSKQKSKDIKLRFGLIGLGRMGITHFSILNNHPDVTVHCVADKSTLVLRMLKKYLHVKVFRDYKDLLKCSDLDAIIISTPPNVNYSIIKHAASLGLHVFVEKPFTTKLTNAIELSDLYADYQRVNQVGYVNRFNEIFLKLKEILKAEVLGKIVRFKSEMFSCTKTNFDDTSGWRSSKDFGGGVVFEMASHAIDLVNYLFGKPDKVTGASLSRIYSRNVDDIVSATLHYQDGKSGTLYVNWSDTSYRKPTNKIEAFGEGGRIHADQHSLKIFLNSSNKDFNLRKGWNTFYITDLFRPVRFYVRGNEFSRQLYDFIECIKNKNELCRCSFKDGLDTLEVIERIYEDFEVNGMVNL